MANEIFLEVPLDFGDRYNNFLAIIVIYLHRNNIRFCKKFSFIAPVSTETCHIIEIVPLLATPKASKICAKGKQIPALYMKLQPYENLLICHK